MKEQAFVNVEFFLFCEKFVFLLAKNSFSHEHLYLYMSRSSGATLLILVSQATLFGVGTLFYLFACMAYESVWPLFPLLFWILAATIALLFIPPVDQLAHMNPRKSDAVDVMMFILGTFVTVGFLSPLGMARSFVIGKGAAYMCLSGSFLYCLAAMIMIRLSQPTKSELHF